MDELIRKYADALTAAVDGGTYVPVTAVGLLASFAREAQLQSPVMTEQEWSDILTCAVSAQNSEWSHSFEAGERVRDWLLDQEWEES